MEATPERSDRSRLPANRRFAVYSGSSPLGAFAPRRVESARRVVAQDCSLCGRSGGSGLRAASGGKIAARMLRDLPMGTVTFLFTDVEGSTRLLHELCAEAYAGALAEHRQVIQHQV